MEILVEITEKKQESKKSACSNCSGVLKASYLKLSWTDLYLESRPMNMVQTKGKYKLQNQYQILSDANTSVYRIVVMQINSNMGSTMKTK